MKKKKIPPKTGEECHILQLPFNCMNRVVLTRSEVLVTTAKDVSSLSFPFLV